MYNVNIMAYLKNFYILILIYCLNLYWLSYFINYSIYSVLLIFYISSVNLCIIKLVYNDIDNNVYNYNDLINLLIIDSNETILGYIYRITIELLYLMIYLCKLTIKSVIPSIVLIYNVVVNQD
jgi:hypothetical protein